MVCKTGYPPQVKNDGYYERKIPKYQSIVEINLLESISHKTPSQKSLNIVTKNAETW